MIEVKALSKNYGDFPALQNANFTIGRRNGITALLGPNGAGKTTTLRLLTGYLQATSGRVYINNQVMNATNHVAIKRKIGYLPETTPLYPEMLVSEYIGFMGRARGLSEEKLEEVGHEMIDLLELGSHLYTPITLLSKGFRQRVALAATLIHKPDYIILDEPTSGLDPNQIQHIRKLIRKLGEKHILILSTHILQEVEDICDRVIILSRGQVVADESASALRSAQAYRIIVKGSNVEKSLGECAIVKNCRSETVSSATAGYGLYVCELKEDKPEALFAHIKKESWELRELAPVARSLQEVFHELTV